jgi:hypothetical protein
LILIKIKIRIIILRIISCTLIQKLLRVFNILIHILNNTFKLFGFFFPPSQNVIIIVI